MAVVDLEVLKENRVFRKYFHKALSRYVFYCKLESFELVKDEQVIGYVVNDPIRSMPMWYFTAKGIQVRPTKHILRRHSLNDLAEITVTEDFWTCSCDDHWINHVTQESCPTCYVHRREDTQRNTILKGGTYGNF